MANQTQIEESKLVDAFNKPGSRAIFVLGLHVSKSARNKTEKAAITCAAFLLALLNEGYKK